jgi:hypothetical protein
MFALFSLNPLEILILGGLVVAVLVGVGVVIFVVSRSQSKDRRGDDD